MVKGRAQDAEQETAKMVVEPVHPGKTLSVNIFSGGPINEYPLNINNNNYKFLKRRISCQQEIEQDLREWGREQEEAQAIAQEMTAQDT